MIRFIVLFLIGVAIGYAWRKLEELDREKCPREIYGYNCRGEGCDHSKRAIAEAEWEMEKHR